MQEEELKWGEISFLFDSVYVAEFPNPKQCPSR